MTEFQDERNMHIICRSDRNFRTKVVTSYKIQFALYYVVLRDGIKNLLENKLFRNTVYSRKIIKSTGQACNL